MSEIHLTSGFRFVDSAFPQVTEPVPASPQACQAPSFRASPNVLTSTVSEKTASDQRVQKGRLVEWGVSYREEAPVAWWVMSRDTQRGGHIGRRRFETEAEAREVAARLVGQPSHWNMNLDPPAPSQFYTEAWVEEEGS